MNDEVLCYGCKEAIYEGQEVLLIDFNNDEETVIHKNWGCLTALEEVFYGTIGPEQVKLKPRLTRIK